MKKTVYLFIAVILSAFLITSCKDDENTGGEKFSPLTVEQNKTSVEDAGIALVSTMSDMKSIESVDIIMNLGDILNSMEGKKAFMSKDSKLFSTMETFAAAANGEKKVNDVFHAMVYAKELREDPESIQEVWDSIVGTYSWMPDLNDWDIVEGGNSVIFKFPSSENSATNDATLTISNYKGTVIANPIDDDYTGDLPLSLQAELKVGTKTYLTYSFAASYNSDGVPNAIASDLTIENYKFEIDIVNSTKAVSVNYKFLADNKVIMDLGANGAGLFTEANYDDNTHTTTVTHTETYGYWDWVYNPVTGYDDLVWIESGTWTWDETNTETEFEEILNSASAHFQLFDIAIRGDVDVKGLVDELRLIDEDDNISGSQADSLSVVQINKFVNLRMVKVTTNEIIAKAQAYIVKKMHYDWEESYLDFRLTFNDGSLIDTETYFNEGFADFVDELNSLITDLNNEYTLDLEPIEY